jgi:sulfite reductase (NADPH) flavoprotein alpha-component
MLFPRIEVDRGNAEALGVWQQQLTHLAGSSDAPDWTAPAFEPWQLQSSRLLNPGSTGSPLFELCLAPASGALPTWESGDLVQIQIPEDEARPRDYSIASMPEEGAVQLLVRLSQGENGYIGKASGWLTQVPIGTTVSLRLRPHRLFRLGENADRPLILIGNGSGLAGLLGHLKARTAAGQSQNWLIYGERNAATDILYHDQLQGWVAAGHLQRLERVFSRDGNSLRYVQDAILQSASELRRWIDDGAAIYVCGSLEGMAGGVDQALQAVLGEDEVNALKLAGRYRRDVY